MLRKIEKKGDFCMTFYNLFNFFSAKKEVFS